MDQKDKDFAIVENNLLLPADESIKPNKSRHIIIVSLLSWFLAPTTFFMSMIYVYMQNYDKAILGFFVAGVFSTPLIFIQRKRYLLAKNIFTVQFVFICLMLPFVLGTNACTEWIIILVPSLCFLLYGRKFHLLYLAIGMVGYIFIKLTYHYQQNVMGSSHPEIYRFFLAMMIGAFLYWLMVLFRQETLRSEEIIRAQHASLLAAQKELEDRNHSLQMLNQNLQQFAHMASHDMKEPLRTIGSFSSLLSRRLREQPEHVEFLNYIEDGAKRMSKMLDDLISYSKVGIENTAPEPVDLNEIAQNVCKSLGLQLQESEGSIEFANLPVIMGHPTLLTQLFQNLVANGIKYRHKGTPPCVKIRHIKIDDKAVIIFRDNGIGIAPENLTKIFDPFIRLHTRTEFEGNGIGLATCRKIAELYGGSIRAESTEGAGTSIHIEWPFQIVMQNTAHTNQQRNEQVAPAN